jgi:hypothetical protein
MNLATRVHRRWWRRAITVIGLGGATILAVAAPALGHPVFSNDPPGFPNPSGGTGAANQTPPYAPGSRPTLNMFLPFEQDGVIFKGAENTTVDVQVTIPAGWINPACGAASTTLSTGYRQMGTVVPGWSCVIENAGGHQVLHWSGPQVSLPHTSADSAQFFTFPVTVPSPATQTSYGATGAPEGFYVKQSYASGATSLWRSPNSRQAGEVANGLVRTVAGKAAPPPTSARAPLPRTNPTGANPAGANPTRANSAGAKPTGTNSAGSNPTGPPPPQQGDGGSAPAPAAPQSPTGPPTAADPPSSPAQSQPAPTSTDPPVAADNQSTSARQLAQQRDDVTGHGIPWQVLVGTLLGAVLVIEAVIVVVKRRRRAS